MTRPASKQTVLKEFRALNPRPGAVIDEDFAVCRFLDPQDVVQVKYEMVRRVRVDNVPVAQATAAFGFCRQSFYAIAAALDAGGPAALVPGKPGPKGPRKLTEEVMVFVEQLEAGDAALRSQQLVQAVHREFGITVHPRSVEKALARRREPRSTEVPDHR
ncbi:helix-turn-helix domain containing protein [Streptomyces sp. NPDC050211]|uniref:helix-turn-helix domain containing protein n=1 Tax=Streptomyces sp. NPDC050211 TaxID=3154932 RepID=UPI003433D374